MSIETTIDPNTLKPVVNDLAADVQLAIKILAEVKKQGAKETLAAEATNVISAVKNTITDVKPVLPTIKAGYKTTEFWLIVLVLGFIEYAAVKHIDVPLPAEGILASVTALYTAFRHQAKTSAT